MIRSRGEVKSLLSDAAMTVRAFFNDVPDIADNRSDDYEQNDKNNKLTGQEIFKLIEELNMHTDHLLR